MNIFRTIGTALAALNSNKMRSALTMLGIVIGVAAVISLMSIGRGAQAAVTANIESLGTNLVFVRPGSATSEGVRQGQGTAVTLTLQDADALADPNLAPSVLAVAPEIQTMTQIVAGRQNTFTRVIGVTPEYESVRNYPLAEGFFISDADIQQRAMVVVLGSDIANTLFSDGTDPLGQSVKLNSRLFKVVGVLQSKGGTGLGSADDVVMAPITTVQSRLSSQRTINIQVVSSEETDAAIQQITAILEQRHKITDGNDDFTITSQQDTISALQDSTQIWVVFLGAIAGISLLVGGIGIMNIMLVSVTERTREIGIRKSVGAKRRDILLQFLVEAGLLSLVGGGIGVGAGIGASHFMSGLSLGGQTINTVMSADIPTLAVSVSAAIGIVFGLYPAYRAARLNPIDALRYE